MIGWAIPILVVSAFVALLSSALHFALRDFSLLKLEELAGRNGGFNKLRAIVDDAEGHALSMGALRAIAVAATVVSATLLVPGRDSAELTGSTLAHFAIALGAGAVLTYLFAILIPISLADHAGEILIHRLRLLVRLTRFVFWPLRSLRALDTAVRFVAGTHNVTEAEEVEDEILSAASEGEREGALGETERRMIEAVLELRSKATSEIMTPRTEMECLPVESTLVSGTSRTSRSRPASSFRAPQASGASEATRR